MTPQEHTLLDDFLGRLQAAGPIAKDAEADALIRARLDGRPDATYLLVQRCLLLDRALAEANQQIAALQRQAPQGGGSFLGGASLQAPEGFGRAPSQAYSPEPRYEQAGPQGPAYAQAQPQGWRSRWFGGGGAPAAPQAQAAPATAGSGFLGQAATTAAGVAGGMFLFNGIEHLIGGRNHDNPAGGNGLLGDKGAGSDDGAHDSGTLGNSMTENIDRSVARDDGGQQQGFLDGGPDDGASDWADNGGADDYQDDSDSFA